MPITQKLAAKLINRFAPTANFPRGNKDGIGALVDLLAERALSEAHAKAATDSFALSGDRCPAEGDLVRVLHDTRAKFDPGRRIGCPQCIDGWRQCWFLTTMNAGAHWKHERISKQRAIELELRLDKRHQSITEAVEKCQCQGGRVVVPEQALLAAAEEF
jgi:hypothetical protein